jgi:hypothetical protein
VMLVHSFSQRRAGWSDYSAFLKLFGVTAGMGTFQRLLPVRGPQAVPLFAAWIAGDPRFLQS